MGTVNHSICLRPKTPPKKEWFYDLFIYHCSDFNLTAKLFKEFCRLLESTGSKEGQFFNLAGYKGHVEQTPIIDKSANVIEVSFFSEKPVDDLLMSISAFNGEVCYIEVDKRFMHKVLIERFSFFDGDWRNEKVEITKKTAIKNGWTKEDLADVKNGWDLSFVISG